MADIRIGGLLGAIANPQGPDIAGKLGQALGVRKLLGEIGEQRIGAEADKQIAQIVDGTFQGKLFNKDADPRVRKKVLEGMGIDPKKGWQLNLLMGDAQVVTPLLRNGLVKEARNVLEKSKQLVQVGGGDTERYDFVLDAIDKGDIVNAIAPLASLEKAGIKSGLLKDPNTAETPAEERAFNNLIKDMTPENQKKAKKIKAGLLPRATGSAAQTIAELGTAEDVGASEAIIAGRKKFGELEGAARAKAIDKGFASIGRITQGITTIDRAIAAVEDGAGVGALEKFLPSFRAASVELDQIQNELALDVISGVTLGAISAAELELTKLVALPTGLDTPQLLQHLRDRKAAQEKLRGYYQKQINFLDSGGSVADFVKEQKANALRKLAAGDAGGAPGALPSDQDQQGAAGAGAQPTGGSRFQIEVID